MSFSAEMKDFLTAYKTGQGINASRTDQEYKEANTERTRLTTERENDPDTLKTAAEQAKANLAVTNQRMRLAGSARGDASANAALQRELYKERLRQMRLEQQPGGPGIGLPTSVGPDGPVPQGQGVLPIPQSTLNPDKEVDPFPPGSEYNPHMYADGGAVPEDMVRRGRTMMEKDRDDSTRFAARVNAGGEPASMSRKDVVDFLRKPLRYEAGGAVPDDEAAELTPDDEAAEGETGAIPLDTPAGAPTDVSAQSRRREPQVPRGLEGVIAPSLVADATKAGMTFGLNQYGLTGRGGVPSARQQANARLFAQGHGGLTEQEMQAARQTVDPEGKLTDSQRNMAALGSVYQFWANKGEPEKAQRVAFQMLQYYRNASQRYAAIAAKAAEGGNVDLATKAALKAYANVPDGNDLELLPDPNGGILYRLTGPNGEQITKGVATPQQLAASAMGLATGGFDKAILSAAGVQEASKGAVNSKSAGTGRVQSAADRKAEGDLVTPEIERLKTKHAETSKEKPLDDEFWQEATDTAQHLLQQNKSMTPGEAARAAQLLISPDKNGKGNFKLALGENDGDPATITFPNKMKIQLDENMLDRIENSRAARIKAAAAADEESKKPGAMAKAIDGAKLVGQGLSKIPSVAKNPLGHAALHLGGMAVDQLKKIPLTGSGALPVDEIGPAP